MSYIRITEFTGLRPAPREGEWYTVDGRDGSVRLERGEAALAAASAGEGHVATRWTGVRIYHRETAPLSDYYRASGKLVGVHADRTVEEVWAEIQQAILQARSQAEVTA